jgi:hypothetical protein
MAARATQGDDEGVGRGVHRTIARVDLAYLDFVPQVQAKTRVRARLERTILDHAGGAVDAFFGRLKDEGHRARQLAPAGRQQLCHRQQNGGVAVVAAGVMGTRSRRAVRLATVGLGQRQPVHVGAQQHRFARFAATQYPHHTGLADAGADLVQTEPLETFGHDRSRPMLLVGELRMAVKIAPQLDQLFALRRR